MHRLSDCLCMAYLITGLVPITKHSIRKLLMSIMIISQFCFQFMKNFGIQHLMKLLQEGGPPYKAPNQALV